MLRTGYVIDARYERHVMSANHPERPERIAALRGVMEAYRRDGLEAVAARPATRDEVLLNHDRSLFDEVAATAGESFHVFDADTQASSDTFDTALLAAGGVLALVDAVMAEGLDNGFAMIRPPGHHAEADRVMGFCFFNNVAIAARCIKEQHGLERILIVDWDVHHGNGTQRSFFADDGVLYVSTHQFPFYPGTGALDEVGVAAGMGFTVNLPFPAGFEDRHYIEAFADVIVPVARQFDPQFVLVSAGFDNHYRDPLGGMGVTRDGFAAMTRSLMAVARDHAGGKLVAVLEGGYSLEGLRDAVPAVLDEMGGASIDSPMPAAGGAERVIDAVRKVQGRFWKL